MVKLMIGEVHVDSCGVDAMFVEEEKIFDGLKVVPKFKLKILFKSGAVLPVYESAEKGNCLNLIPKDFGLPKKGVF